MCQSRKILKRRGLLIALGLLLALSGCGDPKPLLVAEATEVPAPASTVDVVTATEVPAPAPTADAVEPEPTTPPEPADAPDGGVGVTVISTELGQILVDGAGYSLYAFIDDVEGVSVCEGGCAEAWPPLLVDSADLFSGLDTSVVDTSVFSVVPRSDGTNQLKAGDWPLYLFAGDTNPGDITGHLSGDVWFLVSPDGSLIDGPASEPAPVEEEQPDPTATPEEEPAEPPTAVPATPAPPAEPTATPVPPAQPTAIPATPVPPVPAPTPSS